jgi:hypothetical protein
MAKRAFDVEHDLKPRIDAKYIVSSYHRGSPTQEKSTWIISPDQEIECFVLAKEAKWEGVSVAWGVHLIGNRIQSLGINHSRIELKIAKFVDGSATNIWHGYPADFRTKAKDRPPINILASWKDKGIILKHHVRKISGGIECNL